MKVAVWIHFPQVWGHSQNVRNMVMVMGYMEWRLAGEVSAAEEGS
jgi:hypothetical protein